MVEKSRKTRRTQRYCARGEKTPKDGKKRRRDTVKKKTKEEM
jgi:hypothetical protein